MIHVCTNIRLLSLKRCTFAFTTKCREFRALKKVVARKIPHGDFQKLACMRGTHITQPLYYSVKGSKG